jgi:hypothetical protein
VGRCPSPLSSGAGHTLSTFGSLLLSKRTGGGGLFIVLWGSAPPPLPELREPCPLCYISFFFSCLFMIQFGFFSFFSWLGVSLSRWLCWSVQGCLWEYCMLLSSPDGLLLPSRLGAGVWQHGSLPGFSV